jgi:hypothetical protein
VDALTIAGVDIVRNDAGTPADTIAFLADNSRLSLDHVTIGAPGDGRRPIERGVELCNAELYIVSGNIAVSLRGIQGLSSRIALAGISEPDAAKVTAGDYGLLLLAGSQLRLQYASLTSPRALLLRGSQARGNRADFSAGATVADSSAFRLEGGAAVELRASSVRGFRCLGVFADRQSSGKLILPTNPVTSDNVQLSCGNGSMDIVE